MTRNIWDKKGILPLLRHDPLLREAKVATTQGKSLKQRQWKNTVYRTALHSFLSLLSYRAQVYLPGDGTAHSGLGSPTSTVNEENAGSHLTCSGHLMEATSSIRVPLPGWLKLVSSWQRLTSTYQNKFKIPHKEFSLYPVINVETRQK